MGRVLVLYAHPCSDSFSAALHTRTLQALKKTGWEIDNCDLNQEGFNPVLSEAERRGYHDTETNTLPVAEYVERLQKADALVMVYPVWNFGYPAILKGFLDRVFLPGVSFRLEDGAVVPNLSNIRKLAAVTTYGATRWRAILAGDPPRAHVTRSVKYITAARHVDYMALYDMNNASDTARRNFLGFVGQKIEEL